MEYTHENALRKIVHEDKSLPTSIVKNVQDGHVIWRKTWLNQILSLISIALAGAVLLIPFAFLDSIITRMFLVTFILAGAYCYAQENGKKGFTIKVLVPLKQKFVPLVLLTIGIIVIFGIPLVIAQVVLDYLVPISYAKLNIISLAIQLIVYAILFYVFIPPYFLAIGEVIFRDKGTRSIVSGWKLYYRNLGESIGTIFVGTLPLIISGVILVVIGLIIANILGLGLDFTNVPLIEITSIPDANAVLAVFMDPVTIVVFLFLAILTMILGMVVGFLIAPWFIVVGYALHKNLTSTLE